MAIRTEFEFIDRVRLKYGLRRIGDDCAVLPKDRRWDTVITADLLVEGIDFRRAWTTPAKLGHRALAVSLSDVAAMGANPLWSMVSLGIPKVLWKHGFGEKFYEGWYALASCFGVELIGGDVSETPESLVIDSVVGGEAKKGHAVLRSGAKAGDLIFVTGSLGGARGGLQLLDRGKSVPRRRNARAAAIIERQTRPVPRIEEGKRLGTGKFASAMIDISDGLSSDLGHICRASGVGAKIYANKIPVDPNLAHLGLTDDEKLDFALNGGEDFELLFTVDPKKKLRMQKAMLGYPISYIGEITPDAGKIVLIGELGPKFLAAGGYRHFQALE
jgi:thiamine-monophosphate kinase